MRSACTVGILIAVTVASSAIAQTKTAETEAPGLVRVERAEPALWVEVIPGPAQLDPDATRRGIQAELGIAVVATRDEGHVGKVRVEGQAGPSVLVRYASEDGTTLLERHVALPVDPARRCLVVAWVVGNLVRNEAAEILSGMPRRDAKLERVEPATTTTADAANGTTAQAALSDPTPQSTISTADFAATVPPALPQNSGKFAVTKPAPPLSRDAGVHPATSDLGPARVFNLALFAPDVALHHDANLHRYHLSFGGIYSHIGALDGFGMTWFVDRVEQRVKGAQISGVWQQSTDTRGVAVAGIGAFSSGSLVGAELAGLLVVRKGCILGAQIAGLWASADSTCGAARLGDQNVDRRALIGAQLGGAIGYFSAGFRGVQISGIAAMARERSVGLQLTLGVAMVGDGFAGTQAGMVGNIGSGQLDGLQVSGLFNFQRGNVKGLQLTSGVNYAVDVRGMQMGSINIGRTISGVQFGLVNVAQEDDGVAIGLINWSKTSRFQPIYFFETGGLHNLGFRILSRHTTSTISLGVDAAKDMARTHFALGPRATMGRVGVGVEFGYGWVLERLSTHPADRAHELDMIGTVSLEIIRNAVSVYAGGGVAMPVAGVAPIEPRGLAQIGVGLF